MNVSIGMSWASKNDMPAPITPVPVLLITSSVSVIHHCLGEDDYDECLLLIEMTWEMQVHGYLILL